MKRIYKVVYPTYKRKSSTDKDKKEYVYGGFKYMIVLADTMDEAQDEFKSKVKLKSKDYYGHIDIEDISVVQYTIAVDKLKRYYDDVLRMYFTNVDDIVIRHIIDEFIKDNIKILKIQDAEKEIYGGDSDGCTVPTDR